MKKLVLVLAVSMMSVTAFAKTVEITGEKAEALFFEMEKSGATMTIHTPRLTEYNSKNVTCVAEERYTEDGERTGVADFTCLIDVTK
ncbi:hypothetical protein [uncultured Bdellovibrio sp.]|uniref:hypothetical protein n=1 Tax=Bdellovibrio sp. HCB-162 TaxID=3394234 RepID=UPI0025F16C4C|nr:hypothetical protein [uncultured Bdellovibrio sp.]